MKTLLALVLVVFASNALAYTVTEVDPLPPAGSGIPATASRYVDCVAVNVNGVGGVAWIRGVAVNLSTATGVSIYRAAAISNNGVIVGQIARGTKRNGCVLTPQP